MHRHSPTAPQRYPSSSRRQTVIDEQTASTSCAAVDLGQRAITAAAAIT